MIPTRTSRPFGRVSPRVSDVDLARLIDQTIALRVNAKREQGFAATNTGCDGRRRTTMFDGSVCQTEGEVCIATRQDGISACIEAPTQGNGLTMLTVTFVAPVCEPVTGYWLVDAQGYMYQIPQSLIDAAPYWPLTDEAMPEPLITLTRAGTWVRLTCGAYFVASLNGEGGAEWINIGEPPGVWTQLFAAAIGGERAHWSTLPAGTTTDTAVVTVDFSAGVLEYHEDTILLTGESIELAPDLSSGQEVTYSFYADEGGLTYTEGEVGLIGASSAPSISPDAFPVAEVTIPYGYTGSSITITAQALDVRGEIGWLPPDDFLGYAAPWRGILLRDQMSPNPGRRVQTVTLPSAGSGVVTGEVRVAYGYPFGNRVGETPVGDQGTWQADCVGRTAGDMAGVYTRRLGVEYADGHICLDGDAITDPDDFVSSLEMDLSAGPARDANAGLVAMPGAEVVFFDALDTRIGERYRVRPAPDAPVTISVEQQAKGVWGDDPNEWTEETNYVVSAWLAGATTFTLAEDLTATEAPGRGVAVALWEGTSGDTYLTATNVYYGTLGETSGGLTTIAFDDPIGASTLSFRRLTVIGPKVRATWGWTFTVDGVESAMSILTDQGQYGYSLEPPGPLYSIAVTVPGGPTGTTERNVYRFAYDYGSAPTKDGSDTNGPWGTNLDTGGVYDRNCRLVKTLVASDLEPGTDPLSFYDENTSLSTSGTRPPSPLIYVGQVQVDAPTPVHLLPSLSF